MFSVTIRPSSLGLIHTGVGREPGGTGAGVRKGATGGTGGGREDGRRAAHLDALRMNLLAQRGRHVPPARHSSRARRVGGGGRLATAARCVTAGCMYGRKDGQGAGQGRGRGGEGRCSSNVSSPADIVVHGASHKHEAVARLHTIRQVLRVLLGTDPGNAAGRA